MKWKTSNKKVATVSKKGVVKAVKAGKATISAKVKVGKKNKTLKCSVKVNKKKKKTNTQDSPADGGTKAQTPGGQTGNTPGGNTTGGNTPGGSTGTGGDGPSIQTPTDTPAGPSATPTQKPDKPSPVSGFMVTGKFMRNGVAEGEGGNATLDLGGSNLSFQAKGENATEPKIIDNKVYFENGSTMNTVDFSSFLTERGIDLTGYSDIEIDFELLNSKGEVIDTSAKNDLKIALVDSASLDGYSDGIGDAERTDKLFTRYSGGKTTINLPKEAASDVKKIVGINLQLCNWNEGFSDLDYKTLCLKSIRFLK